MQDPATMFCLFPWGGKKKPKNNNVSFPPASRLRVWNKAENRNYTYNTHCLLTGWAISTHKLQQQRSGAALQEQQCLGCSDNSDQATIICYKIKCFVFLNVETLIYNVNKILFCKNEFQSYIFTTFLLHFTKHRLNDMIWTRTWKKEFKIECPDTCHSIWSPPWKILMLQKAECLKLLGQADRQTYSVH